MDKLTHEEHALRSVEGGFPDRCADCLDDAEKCEFCGGYYCAECATGADGESSWCCVEQRDAHDDSVLDESIGETSWATANDGSEVELTEGMWQCAECGRIHECTCDPVCSCLDPESDHECE